MDQDVTWYGGRLWPRRHSVRWGLTSPQKGAHPTFWSMSVNCGQITSGWIKMKLGKDYGGRPRSRPHCVRRGPSSPERAQQPPPIFDPCLFNSIVAKRLDRSRCHLICTKVCLGPGDIVSDGDPAPPRKRMGTAAPTFRPMSVVAKRSPMSATVELLFKLSPKILAFPLAERRYMSVISCIYVIGCSS